MTSWQSKVILDAGHWTGKEQFLLTNKNTGGEQSDQQPTKDWVWSDKMQVVRTNCRDIKLFIGDKDDQTDLNKIIHTNYLLFNVFLAKKDRQVYKWQKNTKNMHSLKVVITTASSSDDFLFEF